MSSFNPALYLTPSSPPMAPPCPLFISLSLSHSLSLPFPARSCPLPPLSPPFSSSSSSSSSSSCSPLCFSHPHRSSSFVTLVAAQNSNSAPLSTAYAAVCENEDVECDVLSGEWPDCFSILNYEDLCKHYEPVILKEEAQPHTFLADVMSNIKYSATPDQLLEEVDHCFLSNSGLPVINEELKCIGVLSKKDRAKASKGLQSTVGEVMTSPAITLSADKTVNDAAVLMLKKKIHRIPIVNEANQVIGMVTRTDIFKALEHGS